MTGKKELFIVRHAKSSWDVDGISDVDRPLKLRGIRNAYEMARRLKIERKLPEHIIASPANRALHTASIFIRVFELPYSILSVNDSFYGAGPTEILKEVTRQDDEINKLMIFGHNPDFSELVSTFASERFIELPTCGMGIFSFDCDSWKNISKAEVTEEFIEYPNKEYNINQ